MSKTEIRALTIRIEEACNHVRELQLENRVLSKKLERESVVVQDLKNQLAEKDRELAAAREADAFNEGYIKALEKVYGHKYQESGPSHPALNCTCTPGESYACLIHGKL